MVKNAIVSPCSQSMFYYIYSRLGGGCAWNSFSCIMGSMKIVSMAPWKFKGYNIVRKGYNPNILLYQTSGLVIDISKLNPFLFHSSSIASYFLFIFYTGMGWPFLCQPVSFTFTVAQRPDNFGTLWWWTPSKTLTGRGFLILVSFVLWWCPTWKFSFAPTPV